MSETGRCIDPACTDGPDDGARWATTGLLCRRCAEKLEQRLAELPARHTALRQALGGLTSRTRGENKPTKGTPPAPLNIAAHDQLEYMEVANAKYPGVLVSWTRLICEERDLRGPDRSRTDVLAPWLLSQLDWILQQDWVREFTDEMRDLTRVADGITAARTRWNRLPAPCPACGGQSLGRWDGDDQVACTECGEQWPESDYPRLVHVLATDRGTSVTAREGADRAGVPGPTFRQWVTRGKVRRLGTVDGLARYSTADIDALRDTGEASCA